MRPLKTAFKWNLMLCVLLLLCTVNALSDNDVKNKPLPLWEVGIAAVGTRLPHYIGSDEYENYISPLPYVIYRGDLLRADRDGVRGIFYQSEKFETNLSFWGNPPVSEKNGAREGMPELDAIGEVGPALRYYVYRHGWQDYIYVQAALRTSWSIDFQGGLDIEMDYQGLNGGLDLYYQNKSLFEAQKFTIRLRAGLLFADSQYNDYFYSVDNRYATTDREAYDAKGGYAGLLLSTGLYKRLTDRLGIGFYARWNNIDGAVFEESSLVRQENNYAIGSTLVWKIAVSKKPAPYN